MMLAFFGQILQILAPMSPLAIIGLLATVIYMLIQSNRQVTGSVDTLASNHMHELSEAIKEVSETLRRIETAQAQHFAFIIAKLTNGGPK